MATSSLVEGKEAAWAGHLTARASLGSITALAVLAPNALGAKAVAQFHDHFTDRFSGELCGIAVDAEVVVTFDLETGEFISSEIIVNKGPHPEADRDFTLFCEVISGALA